MFSLKLLKIESVQNAYQKTDSQIFAVSNWYMFIFTAGYA